MRTKANGSENRKEELTMGILNSIAILIGYIVILSVALRALSYLCERFINGNKCARY